MPSSSHIKEYFPYISFPILLFQFKFQRDDKQFQEKRNWTISNATIPFTQKMNETILGNLKKINQTLASNPKLKPSNTHQYPQLSK